MSHADKADKLLIKPAAGARPAPPHTRGQIIPKARTRRPVTRRVTHGTATTRLATNPDRPTRRVLPSPEIDTATALRRRASRLLVLVVLHCALVVLRCALDRRYPALAPLHPDLGFGLQLEGRLIQTSDPNLDERVAGVGCIKEPRPAAGAEAATVIA